ncbi:MAG: hypothetical protein HO274_04410 [Ferrovum myxofaciens]|uniref:hypothetical protein n=1 Tax=Ferrovum myxofaciens TaxID=416213 RepID=UPI0023554DB5|nr:hypothetical protein [Ferrovum myxofaciens]QKE40630.1 MAG: hypothetical protein HO274_04410 [Ferrovum myxofaciens]
MSKNLQVAGAKNSQINVKSGVKLKGSLFCIVQTPQQTSRFFGTGLTEILPF